MAAPEPRNDRLIALVAIGALVLNYPLLRIFDAPALVFGIPVLYLYLFAVWIAVIVLVGIAMERRGGETEDADA